jgi:predicted Zn-dependent peptidase
VLYDPVPGPLTGIAVLARAGSRYDGRHPGIAHLTEHMLFQGTHRLDQTFINQRAGDLGGEHDADTGHEDMVLHFEVFNEDVADALGLLAEQIFHSTVPEERLAKERRVVIDEIRGRQEDPLTVVHEGSWRRFFSGSLGNPICGTMQSLRTITPSAVRRFARTHFTPANMVVSVVGGVSRARLGRALDRSFPKNGPGAPLRPAQARHRATGFTRLRRRDLSQSYLVRLASISPKPREVLALSLAMEIVGADPDARLFQEVRERLGLGYDVSAGVEQGPDWAVAVISASAGRGLEQKLRDTVERTCRDAGSGFSTEELARARKKVRYRFARLADSRLDRAVAHAASHAAGQPSLAQTARILDELGREDVEGAWRRMLEGPTLTTVLSS